MSKDIDENLMKQYRADLNKITKYLIRQTYSEDIYKVKNLRSQEYLNKISDWTDKNLMELNVNKTESMVFNFTNN